MRDGDAPHEEHRERTSQVLRGVLDVCLLSVIAAQPTYGYEMTRRLGERGLGVVGEGSIYPVLGRLQRAGLVETFRVKSENGGPPRKYYRVTEQGVPVLAAWQQSWASTRDAIDAVLSTRAPPADAPANPSPPTGVPADPETPVPTDHEDPA